MHLLILLNSLSIAFNIYYLYKLGATTHSKKDDIDDIDELNTDTNLVIDKILTNLTESINQLNDRISKLESKIIMLDSTITTSQYDIVK